MSPQARMAAGNASLPEAGVSAGAEDAGAGPFVINLTSSTTPMALAHPDTPELKRFTFFVSRRREDNRERFRLHMGYFSTLAEAEEWLNVIRDLYPGAWAGEAPGKKLRARAAAAELAKQLPPPPQTARRAAAPPVQTPPAPREAAVAPVRATPAPASIVVPTLQAAPTVAPAPQPAVAASAAPMLEAVAQAAAALAAVAKTAVAQSNISASISFEAPPPVTASPPRAPAAPVAPPPVVAAPVAVAAAPAAHAARTAPPATVSTPVPKPAAPAPKAAAPAPKPAAPTPKAAAPAPKAAAPTPAAPSKPSRKANPMVGGSNVREVMAALDGSGETRQMPVPPGLRPPAAAAPAAPLVSKPAPKAAPPAAAAPTPAPAPRAAAAAKPAAPTPAAAPAVRGGDSMSDTQVLRMLETRRTGDGERETEDANAGISLLKPDDTQTRRALKEAVLDNAAVSFAVQLQWSVQPVDLASVPPLAIFSAYTLYTVEGSREGRKWYGLRLGFFSDAISAKQVAYYVRSEFNSVAVVPVSPAEKGRATEAETKSSTGAFQRKPVEQKIEEFKLFDDDKPPVAEPPRMSASAPAEKSGSRGAPRKNKPLGRVRAKEQRSPKTLEETLEILGASDLEIDNGRGELLNDTGVRHLRVEVQKNTPFAKLLDRLSERVRRN